MASLGNIKLTTTINQTVSKMKTTKEKIAVMQASEDGKEIEVRTAGHQDWYRASISPTWDWHSFDYRIATESKLRPWRPEEVPVGGLIRFSNGEPDGHVSWAYVILAKSENSICIMSMCGNSRTYTFGELLPNGECSLDHGKTWHPCGIKE